MHSAPDTLRAQQFALTRALRDPAQAGPANIEPRRLKVYQDLLYNNLHSLLSGRIQLRIATRLLRASAKTS
ncbi:MAG: putative DNA-binding domain-containing protein [Aquimonas sp.]|nr:putative DNA-binding domain-containing protein [Aquimonas sp.]